jgi:hypothetical protein
MAGENTTKDPGGKQPDMERGLDAAAKAGGQKPAEQVNTAIPADAPRPSDLKAEQTQAAEILRHNAAKDTGAT